MYFVDSGYLMETVISSQYSYVVTDLCVVYLYKTNW
jgi:hypothetical protein